ncbi:MAG TPA: twin-arginine translocation signal domain-containing protein, partial [Desulfobacteraceae bacterium]|nr:twin-arginine translocation signal domain-containing protein [Desulfobacteraceae bacterium]
MKRNERLHHASGTMDRRSFLKLSGVLGIGLASAAVVIPTGAEAVRFNRKLYKISKTRLAMGTFVSMTLLHASRDQAEAAMGEAFLEIDRLSRDISRFDQTTAIAQLNREGTLKDMPPEVAEVVARSLDYYRISSGAFDISVKPLVDLFKEKFSDGNPVPPSSSELEKAIRLVNASHIEITGRTVRFKRPGMG